jgi:phosphoserine phosphatase RsbU/P
VSSDPQADTSAERDTGEPGLDVDVTSGLTAFVEAVRLRLAADTAVVLMLDPTRSILEPVATAGLGRRARASARIPYGEGFAGRIAAQRTPVILQEVTRANVINPVLHGRGVHSLAGVPLLDGATLVGVLHVGSIAPRRFTDADLAELRELAADLVRFSRAGRSTSENSAALALQSSLVPAIPAVIAGLDIAARYIPAEGSIGGDWYDVFPLPGDRIGIAMGDVMNHGLPAAVVMGRLKSALRAYALVSPDPAEVLGLLDRKIAHFEPESLASVIYGVSTAPYDSITFSNAGHWPPIVAHPDIEAFSVEAPSGLLLGVEPDMPRESFTIPFDPGSALCLFTDGLLEIPQIEPDGPPQGRRDPFAVLPRLLGCVSTTDPAELTCNCIIADVIDGRPNPDDIAVLVIRNLDHNHSRQAVAQAV